MPLDTSSGDAKVAYALIDGSWNQSSSDTSQNLEGVATHHTDNSSASTYSIALPSSTPAASSPKSNTHVKANSSVSLTAADQWYEYYAVRNPSRGFLERREEEARVEYEREQSKLEQSKVANSSGGGWFRRLFLGKSSDRVVNTEYDANDTSYDSESLLDEHKSQFQVNYNDGMCGTSSPLDNHAIINEAQSFHRFHLVSERRAIVLSNKDDSWNVVLPVRMSIGWDDDERISRKDSYLCVVGYGQIAKFPSLPSGSDVEARSGAQVKLTSDWQDLLSSTTQQTGNSLKPLFDLRHCRAASIGPDCLVVSWGIGGEGWVVFYRRTNPAQNKKGANRRRAHFEQILEVGWEAVAVASPSDAVFDAALKNMTLDPISREKEEEARRKSKQQQHQYMQQLHEHRLGRLNELGSLRVTDLVTMVINNDDPMYQQSEPPSAVLAISRLGGYVELLPLPSWLWLPNDFNNASTHQQSMSPSHKNKYLPNLSGVTKITAFSTSEHHDDIMAIDAYRTRVGADLEWDGMHRPDGPPSEIVLAACGCSSRLIPLERREGEMDSDVRLDEEEKNNDSRSTVSLWGVTTIFNQQPNDKQHGDPGFDLSVQYNGCINLDNVGSDASIFATGVTADHWIQPFDPFSPSKGRRHATSEIASPCSISTIAPLVSLRFTPRSMARSGVFLAALDYNGGVSVLNCTLAIQLAEHTDTHHTDTNLSRRPSMSLLCGRDATTTMLSAKGKQCGLFHAAQIEWWCADLSLPGSFSLAMTSNWTRYCKRTVETTNVVRLRQWSIEDEAETIARDLFCIPVSSQSSMILPMQCFSSNETLPFVQLSDDDHGVQLSFCGVRKFLDPTEIITTLLHRSDAENALTVARKFGGAEHFGGTVMNNCRMQLWEDQRDAQALLLVSDHEYVIREALSMSDTGDEGNSGLELDSLRAIYTEALARCNTLASSEVNASWLESSVGRLRHLLRLMGTFELLLKHFTADATSPETATRRFFHTVQQTSLYDIASSIALRGDISALTLLLVRHPVSTTTQMRILDLLPVELSISEYEHLLPCCVEKECSAIQFLPRLLSSWPVKWLSSLEVFSFLADAQMQRVHNKSIDFTMHVFHDEADRQRIIEHYWEGLGGEDATQEDVAKWYLNLAIRLHVDTGQIHSVGRVCELGIIRLGFVVFEDDGKYKLSNLDVSPDFCRESEAIGKLVYLYSATDFLSNILADKVKDSVSSSSLRGESWAVGREFFASMIQFCSMDMSSAVPFILESAQSPSSNVFLFHNYVAQFVHDDGCLLPTKTEAHPTSALEQNMKDFCLKKVKSAGESHGRKRKINSYSTETESLASGIEEALSICSLCASFGRQEKSLTHALIIRSNGDLIDFACDVFQSTLKVANGEQAALSRGVVDQLWKIFESLPSRSVDGSAAIVKVAWLHLRLAMLQLCCKWNRGRAIPNTLWKFLSSHFDSEDQHKYCVSACQEIITIICRGLCEEVTRQSDETSKDYENALLDFALDVGELDQRFYGNAIQHSGRIGTWLLLPLLSLHEFGLLKDLLQIRPSWFCQDQTQAIVLSFVRDTIIGSNNAFAYQETLCSVLPELAVEFEHAQRLFDAERFANKAMRLDTEVLSNVFIEDNSANPMNIIECLLTRKPQCLLLGCEFWSEDLASKAAEDASRYFSSQINATMSRTSFDESSLVLPPMPGALVMQLSIILDLKSAYDLLMVKRFMVLGVLQLNLAPAAIAICYSMLCDAAFSRQENVDPATKWTERHELVIIQCVVATLGASSFGDIHIKKDLCTQSIRLISGSSSLLGIYEKLEQEQLIMETEIGPPTPNNNIFDCELAPIFREIKQRSSVDAPLLIASLANASSNEPNLESLSEAFFYWVVAEASSSAFDSHPSRATRVMMIVELGAACLAEITDRNTSVQIMNRVLKELHQLSSENDITSSGMSTQPDHEIVRRLNERGYSWNAGRRAAIMTGNRSYSDALTWAVSHFQDDDFDAPMYIIKTDSASIDRALVATARGFLQAIQNNLNARKKTTVPARTALSTTKPMQPNGTVATKPATPSKAPPTPADALPPSRNLFLDNQGDAQPVASTKVYPITVTAPLAVDTPKDAQIKTGIPTSSDSISSVEGSLSSHSSINKQVNRGKVLGTQKLSMEERKKLALEGRRLLEAARARNKRVTAPPSSIMTSKPAPNLS
eukprot:scaffold13325_cov287-Alexandrium_tamarense.AAC.10